MTSSQWLHMLLECFLPQEMRVAAGARSDVDGGKQSLPWLKHESYIAWAKYLLGSLIEIHLDTKVKVLRSTTILAYLVVISSNRFVAFLVLQGTLVPCLSIGVLVVKTNYLACSYSLLKYAGWYRLWSTICWWHIIYRRISCFSHYCQHSFPLCH